MTDTIAIVQLLVAAPLLAQVHNACEKQEITTTLSRQGGGWGARTLHALQLVQRSDIALKRGCGAQDDVRVHAAEGRKDECGRKNAFAATHRSHSGCPTGFRQKILRPITTGQNMRRPRAHRNHQRAQSKRENKKPMASVNSGWTVVHTQKHRYTDIQKQKHKHTNTQSHNHTGRH